MEKRDRIYTLEKENEEISLKIYRLLEKKEENQEEIERLRRSIKKEREKSWQK